MVAIAGGRMWLLPEVSRRAGVSDEAIRRLLRKRRDLEARERAFPNGPRLFSDAEVEALVAVLGARSRQAVTPA